ncbi:aldehyde dehydrogenase family protein [Pseudonocardia sp. MCCB 268]|nr:aldehyde dehydrogenase family protein [Pseudonocardia cytotoxica]
MVKAAPESQLVMRLVAECAADAGVPAGALSILCRRSTSPVITAGPRVAPVSLIGRSRRRAGRSSMRPGSGLPAPILRAGGKSAALVLDDAPVDAVLRSSSRGHRRCRSGAALLSRILVLRAGTTSSSPHPAPPESSPMGYPFRPCDRGRATLLISAAARERTEGFVERAVADGARSCAAAAGLPASTQATSSSLLSAPAPPDSRSCVRGLRPGHGRAVVPRSRVRDPAGRGH